jgi:hypothetical protein
MNGNNATKKLILCVIAYAALFYLYGWNVIDYTMSAFVVLPSTFFLLLPSCHAYGAQVCARYDGEVLPRFTRDLAARGIVLSDETHAFIRDWLVHRQMILVWKPDTSVEGIKAKRAAELAALDTKYLEWG